MCDMYDNSNNNDDGSNKNNTSATNKNNITKNL